jgi:phosphate/sulfate permease
MSRNANGQNRRERTWTMLKKTIALLIFSTLLAGCVSTSVYVLDQAELVRVKTNQTVTAKYDGWLLSDRAVDRVMNAKINKAIQ